MAVYLGDKSALARLHHDDVLHRVSALYLSGQIATCSLIDLEVLYSARTKRDYEEIAFDRSLLPQVSCDDLAMARALEVQRQLADRGQHRLPVNDLVIAAAAEHAGLSVLHYDGDFDLIAEVTGQPMEWVVPRGTVP
jgi:predicted nucleic acid-binding protein